MSLILGNNQPPSLHALELLHVPPSLSSLFYIYITFSAAPWAADLDPQSPSPLHYNQDNLFWQCSAHPVDNYKHQLHF